MVALDRNSRPMPVKQVKLETEEQKEAYADGKRHYDEYKAKKKHLSEARHVQQDHVAGTKTGVTGKVAAAK